MRKEVIVMNKEIISKIKEKAYENVNKKLEEERKETERKINDEIEVVEEILKYIKNKLIFKKVGDNWRQNYVLVTEDIFFEDYNSEPEYNWRKGIEIKHEREKKWDYFIKVNGQYYYDVRYIIANYEEEYEILKRRLSDLKSKFREIEEQERGLLALEPKIKKLLEQYQEVEIEEKVSDE